MSRGDTRRALASLRSGIGELLRLRWVRIVVVAGALLLLARAGLGLLVGKVLDGVLAGHGLECDWEDLDLSLLGGRGELRDLRIAPRGALADPDATLVEVEYGVFDLAVLPLLRGSLRIGRAEVDGLDVYLGRDPQGVWNLERHFDLATLLAASEEEEPSRRETEDGEIDLEAPLAIDALRLQQARLHVRDELREPVFEVVVEGNAGLSYLGNRGRPTRFSLTVTAGDLLDGTHVAGQARLGPDALHVVVDAQTGGLHPAVLASYLEPFGIGAACETLGASAHATLDVAVLGEARDTLSIEARVSDLQLTADGAESLALDGLRVEAPEVSPRGAHLAGIWMEGARARVSRRANGRLHLAGFDLGPADVAAQDPLARSPLLSSFVEWSERDEADVAPSWSALLVGGSGEVYPWTLDGLELRDGHIEWNDAAVQPAVTAPLFVDHVRLGTVVHAPARNAPPVSIDVAMAAPGSAESIRLTGSVGPFAPERSVDLDLAIDGIVLEAVEPYLNEAGLERALQGASFRVGLKGAATTDPRGRTEGWIEVQEAGFQDEAELFGVQHVAARGLVYDPEERLLRAGEIEVDGPRLSFVRDASSRFVALGLRVLGFGPDESTPPSAPTSTTPTAAGSGSATPVAPPAALPRFEIGRLAWTNSQIAFVDHRRDPPERVEVEELGFELTGLVLGGPADAPAPEPAHLVARLAVPGVADELALEGSVMSRPGAIDLESELELTGHGLRGELLASYLEALGLEPRLEDGRLAARLTGGVRIADGLRLHAALRDAELSDGGVSLASVEELRVDDVLVDGPRTDVGALVLVRPFARLQRLADGSLQVAGWRLGTPPEAGAAPEGEAPPTAEVSAPLPLVLPPLPPALLHRLSIEGARVAWSDQTFEPALELELHVDASAEAVGTLGAPGTFALRLAVPEAVEALETRGSVAIGPDELALEASVEGRGIGGTTLGRLLPPGVTLAARDGRLALELSAKIATVEAGGLACELDVRDLAWLDEGAAPWLSMRRAHLALARVDPLPGVVEIADARVEGLELALERDAQGRVELLGLVLGEAPPEGSEPAGSEPPPNAPGAPVAAESSAGATPLPTVTLARDATFELERVTYRDAALGDDAPPIEAQARFSLVGPCTLLAPDAQTLAPLALRAEAALSGIVETARLEASVAPFAPEPHVEARLAIAGVRTQGLVERAPVLAEWLTGEVEEGEASGRFEARFEVRRARPVELGFERPFGAEIAFDDIAYRDAPGGAVLAGVERVAIDVARVDTAKGLVHVREVDVVRPQGRLLRDDEGVHALGLLLRAPASTAEAGTARPEPEPAPETGTRPVQADVGIVEAASERPAEEPFDLRIDRLLVSGIDVSVRDETGAPALDVPLTELDFELKRFSTRALEQGRPVRFYSYLGASTPADAAASGLPETPLFDELVVSGRVAPFPEPSGWTRVSLSGLELRHFTGLARQQDVEIEDGALDTSVRVRLQGTQVDVGTSLVFSDLSVTEPKGGALERLFSLPVALDSALFVLRNAAGEHRFSVGFSLDEDGLSTASVVRGVTGAMAEVLAGALIGAPLRLVGALAPGGDGGAPVERWSLAFDPGSAELDPAQRAVLRELGDRFAVRPSMVAVLRHELSADDLARAEGLANPSPAECLDLAAGLRRDRDDLRRQIEETTARAEAYYAVGAPEAEAATLELRRLANELLELERGLDEVLEIVHADSDRQHAKRARVMAREIAELRLEAVAGDLRRRASETRTGRVEVRPARVAPIDAPGGGRVIVELRRR